MHVFYSLVVKWHYIIPSTPNFPSSITSCNQFSLLCFPLSIHQHHYNLLKTLVFPSLIYVLMMMNGWIIHDKNPFYHIRIPFCENFDFVLLHYTKESISFNICFHWVSFCGKCFSKLTDPSCLNCVNESSLWKYTHTAKFSLI